MQEPPCVFKRVDRGQEGRAVRTSAAFSIFEDPGRLDLEVAEPER
jgi:hypothetical protein